MVTISEAGSSEIVVTADRVIICWKEEAKAVSLTEQGAGLPQDPDFESTRAPSAPKACSTSGSAKLEPQHGESFYKSTQLAMVGRFGHLELEQQKVINRAERFLNTLEVGVKKMKASRWAKRCFDGC
jgi:hypothetical protein